MHEVQTAVRPHRAFKTAGVQSCLFGSVNHGVVRGSRMGWIDLIYTLCEHQQQSNEQNDDAPQAVAMQINQK